MAENADSLSSYVWEKGQAGTAFADARPRAWSRLQRALDLEPPKVMLHLAARISARRYRRTQSRS